MATSQDIIKEAAKLIHQRRLKELGFKKTGYTWRSAKEWPQIFNIQLLSSNSVERSKITLNFGVFIEELHTAAEACPVSGAIKEYDCDVRARIGQLLPSREDEWWEVTCKSSPTALADELLWLFTEHGLPWLCKFDSYRAVALEHAHQNNHLMAALSYVLANELDKAQEHMDLACSKLHRNARPKLRRLAGRYNLTFMEE